MVGASDGLSRVVWKAESGSGAEIWAWDEHTGMELVSVLPDGSPVFPPQASTIGESMVDSSSVGVEAFEALRPHGGVHPMSEDATRIFFVAGPGNVYGAVFGTLYMRDTNTQTTVLVSGSERAGEVGTAKEVAFLGGDAKGDVAYFQASEAMTDEPAPNGGIYRWDLSTGKLTLVAAIGALGGLTDRSRPSDDGSHFYFTTHEALPSGGTDGRQNLYVWSGGETKFIASHEGSGAFVRTSLDGRYALFVTSSSIDGSTNAGHEAIFEYDAATGTTSCASCRPDGSPSEGDATLEAKPFSTGGRTTMRNISNSGQVFFTSTDRIVPADRTSARDVYEYNAGTVSLLSAGQGDTASYVADNSDDGRNVFILSHAPLVPEDRDASDLDMYDVRVNGGFPSREAASPVQCNGEGCQGEAVAAPTVATIASQGIVGGGNVQARHKKKAKKHLKKRRKHHARSADKRGAKHNRNTTRNGRTGR